ncbi:hypothetical protein [Iningainema tapete]|uniref:Uncharacterized protein n=1 Tax=Iningainema tapete BLCC-T55 TaxID=2748662 RepID=A0A8J6XV99_9CYAN|nr:hypothetical protein [Iningainema tapete]MBD2776782.1 hypothetical protein [Iningainema tapete BLCC-T55]
MGINCAILSFFCATMTLAILPGIANSQSPIPTTETTAPANPASTQVNELTPQQRGAVLQSLLRQRNVQIIEILDENQKSKFYEALRKRKKLVTALDELKLTPEQENRVNAIIGEYNAKVQAVKSGQPPQSTPRTTAP